MVSYYFDGSMAHVHWIDGTAYDADTFGETDSTTGIWKPKTAPICYLWYKWILFKV